MDMCSCLHLELITNINRYTGLILSFSLPKSSYATMALRELLHRNESKLQMDHQQLQHDDQTRSTSDKTMTNIDDDNEDNVDPIDDILV
jgi:hypothetical protein